MPAPDAGHEDGVGLGEEREAERQPTTGVEDVLGGAHVVEDLAHVTGGVLGRAGLEQDEVGQRRAGSLDPAAEDRLPTDQRPGQQHRVRQRRRDPPQLADRLVGGRQPAYECRVQLGGWRQRRRHEGVVAALGPHDVAALLRREALQDHARLPA